MHILRGLLAMLTFPFLLTGCLTIEEHYSFKKNGSGSMTYVVDMSELGRIMAELKDLGGENSDDMGRMDLSEEVAALEQLPGIRKVKLDNKKAWVQRISFDFDNVGALNGALNLLLRDSTDVDTEFFRWEGNTLVRINNAHARQLGQGMAGDEGEEGNVDLGALLGSMKYHYYFQFAQPVEQIATHDSLTPNHPKPKVFDVGTDFAVIAAEPGALDLRIAVKR